MIDELIERLTAAHTRLQELAIRATNGVEQRRLRGKAEGVSLALSYAREIRNQGEDVDDDETN